LLLQKDTSQFPLFEAEIFYQNQYQYFKWLYKKPLKVIVKSMLYKERQRVVLTIWRTTDPEMDQELYTPACMLQINAKSIILKNGRLTWMDGSDSDDGDQHSWSSIQNKAESQPLPVNSIFII
jgi:hypothetical protein